MPSQTGEEKGRKTLLLSHRGSGTQELSTSPSPKPLTVFCSFLDPSFILRCIWSQPHQVKPGRRIKVSSKPLPAPRVWGSGSWVCSALPLIPTGQWILALQCLHPSHSPKYIPKRVLPTPATQSTHQEGITIFMLRVTGIRGLWRKQFGCFSSSAGEKNPSQGKRGGWPSWLQLQDASPKGQQQAGATRPSLGAAM